MKPKFEIDDKIAVRYLNDYQIFQIRRIVITRIQIDYYDQWGIGYSETDLEEKMMTYKECHKLLEDKYEKEILRTKATYDKAINFLGSLKFRDGK